MERVKTVIRVANLHKRFRYWSDRTESIKTLLIDMMRLKFSFGRQHEFVAIRDVSFEIKEGEFVGIMGRNGAGKSTLLKLISGIYSPTSGSIDVFQQIAPLLELGAGFHGDLSGYENIFLNAAILGFGRNATTAALPQILEFAELGEKIHMPVKNYSSGMLVRLGFSIATHLDAPILLIDEVLAVGDMGFQAKCIRKIQELHSRGRTVVLVTHSPDSVAKYCNRCIVIANQKKVFDGPAEEGVRAYLDAVTIKFASELYLKANPDAAEGIAKGAFKDALEHFNKVGQIEGRLPGPPTDFDETFYLAANPDVGVAILEGRYNSAAEHYMLAGHKERRVFRIPEHFDEQLYIRLNDDVRDAIASQTVTSGIMHYTLHGHKESRPLQEGEGAIRKMRKGNYKWVGR